MGRRVETSCIGQRVLPHGHAARLDVVLIAGAGAGADEPEILAGLTVARCRGHGRPIDADGVNSHSRRGQILAGPNAMSGPRPAPPPQP